MEYSRIIGATKVILPVLALALLSSMFLFSRTVDPEDALPYATVDISERARDQQLTEPRIVGQTEGGTTFELTADSARPRDVERSVLEADRTLLLLRDRTGAQSAVKADRATVETSGQQVTFEGDVVVGSSQRYALRTERLEGRIDKLDIVAPGPVDGRGPLGDLTAGGMQLTETDDGQQRLVFTGGVEMLYIPPTQ